MGHKVRTASYELDMSRPPSHMLDSSSCQMKMVHGGMNTDRAKEQKQVAQASSPDPHVINHFCTTASSSGHTYYHMTNWQRRKRAQAWFIYELAQYVGKSQKWMVALLQSCPGLVLKYSRDGIPSNKQSFRQRLLCEKRSGLRIDCCT